MLDYRQKGYGVYLIFMFTFLIFNTIIFSLNISSFIYYCKMRRHQENDFNIYIPGLKSFNFIDSYARYREYTPYISNLGYAGSLYLDCYEGICTEYNDHRNYDRDDSDDDPDDFFLQYNFFLSSIKSNLYNNLSEIKSFALEPGEDPDKYKEYAIYACSKDCALEGKCHSCPPKAASKYGTCHYKKYDIYNKNKYCYASNIIYKWNGLLFTRVNVTNYSKYSYGTNAFSKTEESPLNYKICGYLDEDKNKLCLPRSAECPVNHIEYGTSPPSDGHNYKSVDFSNLAIYYTNEYEQEGIIIDGLFVDSDYKKRYIKAAVQLQMDL